MVLAILLAVALIVAAYAKDKNLPNLERQANLMTWMFITVIIVKIVLAVAVAVL